MIEKLENHRVILYTRDRISETKKWKFSRIFDEFPHELFRNSRSGLYLFTPNLKRYVSFESNQNIIQFKNTL
jgi:hypothetical protein